MEAGKDYPPENLDLSEPPDKLLELVQKQRDILEKVCIKEARDEGEPEIIIDSTICLDS